MSKETWNIRRKYYLHKLHTLPPTSQIEHLSALTTIFDYLLEGEL